MKIIIKPLTRADAYPLEFMKLILPVACYLVYQAGYVFVATLMGAALFMAGFFSAEVAVASIGTIRAQLRLLELQAAMMANMAVEHIEVENKKKAEGKV